MKIIALYPNNLRNEEHSMFHLDFIALVNKFTVTALGLEARWPPYQTAFDAETAALNIVRASVLTDELFIADSERDEITDGLTGTVKSALKHYNPEMRAAATRLKLLFDTNGDLTAKPYDQQTAATVKLISDLEGPYAAEVATLGVGGWVAELKARNNAFVSLKNLRYDENSAKPQQKLKQARAETDKTYRAVLKRIDALIELNGSTAYEGFIAAVNQRIEHLQLVLAQRQGRNAKQEEDGGTSDEESEKKE